MLLGDLTRQDFTNSLPPVLARCCHKLNQLDLANLPLGKQPLEDGIDMNVMEFTTEPADRKQAELHRKFIDIQVLISGEEAIEYDVGMPDLSLYSEYNEDADYQLTPETANKNVVILRPKMFVIFLPNETHKPGVSINGDKLLKKLVVKVPVELL
ncbi:hypothetical protein A6B43_07745 [Vespertiliibacter pulmonis]|uniref:YhcH/YjgK/YiaL family protein n=1 Tax=Vespertiliibacter pulmonis TaxID=1443036 RepID=A0A3N4VRV1_9PAST|nr:N-acetylneuraminate anomerase [Vespertiliibacter pulmonis]QLB21418.1 hypothetical protein A6B43_07745 [Vespertiliibacter pulmonis]RPE85832.1 YhcH/YjgK/YiaL family protein [Vespertiliibacter pulmonis]